MSLLMSFASLMRILFMKKRSSPGPFPTPQTSMPVSSSFMPIFFIKAHLYQIKDMVDNEIRRQWLQKEPSSYDVPLPRVSGLARPYEKEPAFELRPFFHHSQVKVGATEVIEVQLRDHEVVCFSVDPLQGAHTIAHPFNRKSMPNESRREDTA